MKTLQDLYQEHQGKVSDKWSIYLREYDRLFSPYRDKSVHFLEIGIQNGGSLEIWSKYFVKGEIFVGCDINPDCTKLTYDDSRIAVVVGDANTDAIQRVILNHSSRFDLIIDDGSHTSSDIVKSFARYFPQLSEGGLFIAEDLHCSYWKDFEGGLYYPYSSIAFFKRLADIINHEHWGVAKTRRRLIEGFVKNFEIDIGDTVLAEIHSVEFVNSMCIVRRQPAGTNQLGPRFIAGQNEVVVKGHHPLIGQFLSSPDESGNSWVGMDCAPEEQFMMLNQANAECGRRIANLQQVVVERDTQIASLIKRAIECEEQIHGLNHLLFERDTQIANLYRSTSWRLTAPIRQIGIKLPAVSRKLRTVMRILRWAATMQFGKIREALRLKLRYERDKRLIRKSGLFDDAYYQSQFPEPIIDPLRHYLTQGAYEGRWPHPLFDSGWYIHRNPDVRSVGANPLAHFLICWATENRWPNPYFDTSWYRMSNRDFSSVGIDPLTHYMTIGAMHMADPSQEFSTRWYLEQNKDVVKSGVNPLAHFLHHGLMEGRLPCPPASLISGAPVDEAELHCLKLSELGQEVALFITHSPDGRLKPHVRHYLEAFKREGVDIVLIVAADQPFIDNHDWLFDLVTGLFVRENKGYDFAAWAHILRLHRRIYRAEILYLVNDSLLGPTNDAEFHTLLKRVRSSSADIIGLTENEERGWHLQSYFLAIKSGALASFAFHQFIVDIVAYDDKDHVINFYEIKFAPAMKAAGLITEALFASRSIHNQTIYHWRELLAEGFPFLKVMTARDDIPNVDKSGWRDELASHGYDVRLADQLMSDIAAQREKCAEAKSGPLWKSGEPGETPNEVPHVAFIGPNAFSNGLGVAARSYITALMHTNFQTNILPVKRPFHVHHRVAPAIDVYDFVGPADVALVHLNPNESPISVLLDQQQLDSIESASAIIGVFVWESPQLPDYFVKALNSVDAVWAPSQYCADVFRAATNVQVDVIPYVVPIRKSLSSPARQMALRKELQLAANERVILYAFDASSYLVRKNPMALARAFDRSGLAGKGWRLIFKTKLLSPKMEDGAELLSYCNATTGITILNRAMNNEEICALMDLADIYASSHCSEGFGLTIAEAMARGKPVVATDYGGSRDFLSTDCGFPVRCTEWVLEEDFGAYFRGTSWGLVDEAHLAESLVAAAALDDEARVALAERARQKIREMLSPEAVATRMQASLARLLGKAH